MIKTYFERPLQVEAVLWNGLNIDEIKRLCGGRDVCVGEKQEVVVHTDSSSPRCHCKLNHYLCKFGNGNFVSLSETEMHRRFYTHSDVFDGAPAEPYVCKGGDIHFITRVATVAEGSEKSLTQVLGHTVTGVKPTTGNYLRVETAAGIYFYYKPGTMLGCTQGRMVHELIARKA
jgi:hypothetical protein